MNALLAQVSYGQLLAQVESDLSKTNIVQKTYNLYSIFPQSYGHIPKMISLIVLLALIVLTLLFYKTFLRLCLGAVIVPKDTIGIVNKRFVLFGRHKTLPPGEIIAQNGEAGIQADILPPGIHFGYWSWQYSVKFQEFITIDQNYVGVVESRGGKALGDGHVLGKRVECDSFQDVVLFLKNGGQRGPQISIIPPGTYRINTAFFSIAEFPILEIPDDQLGVVTTKDGQALNSGDIAGKDIGNIHNSFQDGQTFIDHGGFKGLQEQVLLAGRYFINPMFAAVELQPLTQVPIAHAGVVIAFVGDAGEDVTGENFKHGNLVKRGQKGVWVEVLDPGKYPINAYTHKVEIVPTANVVLNWADNAPTGAHKLDENLSTITVRSSDGFTFNLDVSQIIHIPSDEAPKVIARFGSMQDMVTQVLEPIIGNYFRNAAQASDVIEFLKNRTQRQKEAKDAISGALAEYNVHAVDTLIGDIVPPDQLMKPLTDRKIAEQENITYTTQCSAQETRQKLEQAKAMADTQANVVASERKVSISDFDAQSAVKTADGEAKAKIINADADAKVIKMIGEAEAFKTKSVGEAEANVIKLKIDSMESSNYALVKVAEALAANKIALVPEILVAGGAQPGGNGTLVDVLLANLVKGQLSKPGDKKE